MSGEQPEREIYEFPKNGPKKSNLRWVHTGEQVVVPLETSQPHSLADPELSEFLQLVDAKREIHSPEEAYTPIICSGEQINLQMLLEKIATYERFLTEMAWKQNEAIRSSDYRRTRLNYLRVKLWDLLRHLSNGEHEWEQYFTGYWAIADEIRNRMKTLASPPEVEQRRIATRMALGALWPIRAPISAILGGVTRLLNGNLHTNNRQ